MRVLLTRPQKDSELTAGELAKLGYTSIIEPLLNIEPIDTPKPDLNDPQAVMLTSAHALDFLAASNNSRLLNLPCFCVSSHTATAARTFGFNKVIDAEGDGVTLAKKIIAELKPEHGAILHIAARDRDDRARDMLEAENFRITTWVTYCANTVQSFTAATVAAWQNGQIDAVLLFSSRSAATLQSLMQKHGLEACCKQVMAIGISDMVLAAAGDLPWRLARVAEHPTEAALLHLLQTLSAEAP